MENILEIHVPEVQPFQPAGDIYDNRSAIVQTIAATNQVQSQVTVWVQAYNQLEKTKQCVESILKYTDDVDYDLLLVDNGSTDGIMEYFKSIPHDKKRIVHIDTNVIATFPYNVIPLQWISNYVVMLAADLIVTKNWLSNMLRVMESDKKIGLVNPVCSNTSNAQNIDIQYNSLEEMQNWAAEFNQSNPAKWQERMRIITLGTLVRKECLYAIGWPMGDVGFVHDFGDDDIAFRVRRVGYKVVLAGDTWICHNHPVEDRYNEKCRQRLEHGREDFKQKYRGIDAWDDVNNYVFPVIGNRIRKVQSDYPHILGVDVKCGTPILDIKNRIRSYGIMDAECSAFTQEEKYVTDLKTICDGKVICDREEFFYESFAKESQDYIFIDREINRYHEPVKLLLNAYDMLKSGGQLFFKFKNAYNIFSLFQLTGLSDDYDPEFCYNYPMDVFFRAMRNSGLQLENITTEPIKGINGAVDQLIDEFIEKYTSEEKKKEMRLRMTADKIWFSVKK